MATTETKTYVHTLSLHDALPIYQWTITPKITLPVPEAWGTISALANFYYQSSVAFDPANRINGIAQRGTTVDGYGKLDLRMDWRNIAGSNFSLAAYARNVTNKNYVTGSANQLRSFGTLAYTYSEPRLIGGELTRSEASCVGKRWFSKLKFRWTQYQKK